MAKKFKPEVNGLVVMNDLSDAALFRVRKVDGRIVSVVDRSIEDMNPREQHIDISLCKAPSNAQLMQLD
jgi:hypothetical protein